jgi:hypothetical protein
MLLKRFGLVIIYLAIFLVVYAVDFWPGPRAASPDLTLSERLSMPVSFMITKQRLMYWDINISRREAERTDSLIGAGVNAIVILLVNLGVVSALSRRDSPTDQGSQAPTA